MVDATIQTAEKLTYQSPSIVKVGDFDSLTQHTGDGEGLDAVFPAGTKRSALTFS